MASRTIYLNSNIFGTISCNNIVTVSSNLNILHLYATGNATFDQDILINRNSIINGSLIVSNNSTFGQNIGTSGLIVSNNTVLNGSLLVSGDATFNGNGHFNTISYSNIKYTSTRPITSNYIMQNTDYLVFIDTLNANGTITITLPVSSEVNDREFIILDGTGKASQKNILINVNESSSDFINGQTSLLLNSNYISVKLFAYGKMNRYCLI